MNQNAQKYANVTNKSWKCIEQTKRDKTIFTKKHGNTYNSN